MGIVAALQLDGGVSLYAVPHLSAIGGGGGEDGPIYREKPFRLVDDGWYG